MRFSARYLALACALFAIEVGIALEFHDGFVRPFVGDVLVVVLIYCALLSVAALPRTAAALGVFAFACAVEVAQGFDLVERLHVRSKWLRVVIGTSFDARDFLAYAIGTALILLVERARLKVTTYK